MVKEECFVVEYSEHKPFGFVTIVNVIKYYSVLHVLCLSFWGK